MPLQAAFSGAVIMERVEERRISMNYACISDQPFVTKKDLSVRKPLSPEAKSIREFYRSHSFAVCVEPSSNETQVKITKERHEA